MMGALVVIPYGTKEQKRGWRRPLASGEKVRAPVLQRAGSRLRPGQPPDPRSPRR
ncbi:MAG TPA: hypothetical protein VHU17_17945 [Acidimicrobiales bacterium]|nr:hypothetical protein [Acidimicrobiales bacterium]